MRKTVIEIASKRGVDPNIKTWNDVRLILNEILGKNNSTPKTYQEIYRQHLMVDNGEEIIQDITKEKYKLQDIKREYTNLLRTQSRIETLNEQIITSLENYKPIEWRTDFPVHEGTSKAVVNVSDWHIGAKHDNYMSEYSLEIARERVMDYACRVVEYIGMFGIDEILIINLNDLVEGNIHVGTRIEAELNVIHQTIEASMLLVDFITYIYNESGVKIKVGSVLDNHSRVNKNHKDHIEAESFGKLLDYIVQLRINNPNIRFIGNAVDDNIGFTQFYGKNIAWVHGHLDTMKKVKESMDEVMKLNVDHVFIAHRHHPIYEEYVVQVGSLKGTDSYALSKRLFSKASQTIMVFHKRDIIHITSLYE